MPQLHFGRSLFSVLFVGLFASAVPVRASLILTVTESGGPAIPINDNGVFDANPALDTVSVDVGALNLLLIQFQFTTLGASDNAGLPGTTAFVTQTGEVVRLGGGSASITINASDMNFLTPAGNPKSMGTAASDTFLFTAPGNSRTFQSTFNNAINSPLLAFIPPVGIGPFGTSNPGVTTPLGAQATPFSLSNTTVITLNSPNPGGSDFPHDQFTGATTVAAVPEPTSCLLLLAGTALLVRRRPAKR